jgi:hypothetical protein
MVVLRNKATVAAIDLIVDPRGAAAAALHAQTETWRIKHTPGT